MAKTLPKEKIQQQAHGGKKLSEIEEKVFSLASASNGGSPDNENPYIALKYFRESFECFSEWEKDELKAFSVLISNLRQRTWRQVLETSGKTKKTSLAYTTYDVAKTSDSAKDHLNAVRSQISPDINFFELRVDQKMRVHGFRSKAAFFLVLLDRQHRVFP